MYVLVSASMIFFPQAALWFRDLVYVI